MFLFAGNGNTVETNKQTSVSAEKARSSRSERPLLRAALSLPRRTHPAAGPAPGPAGRTRRSPGRAGKRGEARTRPATAEQTLALSAATGDPRGPRRGKGVRGRRRDERLHFGEDLPRRTRSRSRPALQKQQLEVGCIGGRAGSERGASRGAAEGTPGSRRPGRVGASRLPPQRRRRAEVPARPPATHSYGLWRPGFSSATRGRGGSRGGSARPTTPTRPSGSLPSARQAVRRDSGSRPRGQIGTVRARREGPAGEGRWRLQEVRAAAQGEAAEGPAECGHGRGDEEAASAAQTARVPRPRSCSHSDCREVPASEPALDLTSRLLEPSTPGRPGASWDLLCVESGCREECWDS